MNKRLWLIVTGGIGIIALGLLLHFIPIKQEQGFVRYGESEPNSTAIQCETRVATAEYRLIWDEGLQYDQAISTFYKTDPGNYCPPVVLKTVKLFVL